VLIASMVLTVGLVAMAELMAVSLRSYSLGRNSTSATRMAQEKFDQLMKLNFALAPSIQINAANTLGSNITNYFDTPSPGFTRRWKVEAGPTANLRIVTVRVIPPVADLRTAKTVEIAEVIRSW
jgi:hypothetical protein